MTEETNRLYAAQLLNRALDEATPFDARDVAIVARIITLIEHDAALWLADQLRGTVSRTIITSGLQNGLYRRRLKDRSNA
tara:strand:- start:74220 stop:74459 length:240 start_codon:yes stop_codon:yes gene_type:complete